MSAFERKARHAIGRTINAAATHRLPPHRRLSIPQRAFHSALRPIPNFLNRINLFLSVQSLSEKYSSSYFPQITHISHAVPFLARGVGHRHERWDGMRWTRQRRARNCGRRAVFRERPRRADERCCFCRHQCFGGRAHAAEAAWRRRVADGKTVWFWHPLLVLNRRRCCEPNRALAIPLIRR
jgi:hypothetical protein